MPRSPLTGLNRYMIPVLVFAVAAAIGLFSSWSAYNSAEQADQTRFETLAGDVVQGVRVRIGQQLSLLQATRSFFDALGGPANGRAFSDFVDGLDLDGEFKGAVGLGFALRIVPGEEADAEDVIRRNYDVDKKIWPDTDLAVRTPVILSAHGQAKDDGSAKVALGYDMYTEAARRSAMRTALTSGEARATAPIELVHADGQPAVTGFIVYLPYLQNVETGDGTGDSVVSGYVYSPFGSKELFDAVLENVRRLPAVIEAYDITDGDESLLYKTPDSGDAVERGGYMAALTLPVAGRIWLLNIYSTADFKRSGASDLALVLGVVSVLLAIALGVSAHAQLQAAHVARELNVVSERNLQEKDLMLQEMKHRIKNSIARILAMARQTAQQSDDLTEFNETFSARMQAMATAQDMLTRSRWQRVGLRELVSGELEQVIETDGSEREVAGPDVELDEKAVQSLGLTFHELATNALKYSTGNVSVTWEVAANGAERMLVIHWIERGSPVEAPSSSGFGTRLIDTSIKAELSGEIVRNFGAGGLHVTIKVPPPHFIEAGGAEPPKRRGLRGRKPA